jgi:hypothetical protein
MDMPSTSDALISRVRKIVADHYEKDSSPLLLSDLGAILRKENFWLGTEKEGKSLRQFIEEVHDPDLLIVRDKNSPAYVAVTTEKAKKVVEQYIDRRSQTTSTIPDLEALPRSLLLAFCVRQEDGKRVYLQKSPPFKYQIAATANSDEYLLVDDRYRRPGLNITDLTLLSASDRLDLQTKIVSWGRDNEIKIEDLYVGKSKRHANALERLLAAQPRGSAEKIMIPGDIALILIQHD